MARFLVTYDLVAANDYRRIIAELERLGAVRSLLSTYLVNVNLEDSAGFLQHLRAFVDADDRLMVVKLTERPSYTRAFTGTNEWIARNFP